MPVTAVFDCSSGDSFATQSVAASTAFTVTAVVQVPSSTLAALTGVSASDTATFVRIPGGTVVGTFGNIGGLFWDNGLGPWQWWELSTSDPVTGTPSADVDYTIQYVLTHVSGTTWDVVYKVGGVTLFTDTGLDLHFSNTDPFQLDVGGPNAWQTPGETYWVQSVEVKNAANAVVFTDDFSSNDFSAWDSTTGDVSVVAGSPDGGGAGGVRIGVAFNDATFEAHPTWTYITDLDDVTAAAYEIDKGKQTELDQVDTTKATVNVFDKTGVLDPTNSTGPYYGLIDPLLQIQIELWNPCTSAWQSRFRGFIQDYDYVPYPGSHVDPVGVVTGFSSLQISAVGIMEPLSAIKLQLGAFGDAPPVGTEGNIFFDNATFQDRINQVMGNAAIDAFWFVAFTGNVQMAGSRYSPSDNVMSVVQDTVDAELPTVANAYEDRFGRLACHGRLAEFDPAGVAAGASPGAWDFHEWNAGDGIAVAGSPSDTAHIRSFAFNRGLGTLFNSAYCTPAGIAEGDKAGQVSSDVTSIGRFGIRSWAKENLYLDSGLLTGNTANQETKLFADFIVANLKDPKNRITDLGFKSMSPEAEGAAANWDLLCRVDVSDSINVTITLPGRNVSGPNFNAEPGVVQGIHEKVSPLTAEYALVETQLDVSPRPTDTVGLSTPG